MSRKQQHPPELLAAICAGDGRLSRNVHVDPQQRGVWWVETRYSRRYGWWSILWPWPEPGELRWDALLRQDAGHTLPFWCDTREEAAEWAWTLAAALAMKDEDRRARKRGRVTA